MGGQIRRGPAWSGQRCGEERRGPGCGTFQETERGLVHGERWASRSQIHAWVTRAPEPNSRREEPGRASLQGVHFGDAILRQLMAGSGAGSWLGAQTWGHRVEKETGSGTEKRAGGHDP